MPTVRVTRLAEEHRARLGEWADRWIATGLRTAPADREQFEKAARTCYHLAGRRRPKIEWEASPACVVIDGPTRAKPKTEFEVDGAMAGRIEKKYEAVWRAVRRRVAKDVLDEVVGEIDAAGRPSGVGAAVRQAVDLQLGATVHAAAHDAVWEAANFDEYTLVGCWSYYIGGSYARAACTSFFREVVGLMLPAPKWRFARAYEATLESAWWWWPHRKYVLACDRPLEIHHEPTGHGHSRSWRLHRDDGPAVHWPGWDISVLHGLRVPGKVVMQPESITRYEIEQHPVSEVRHVMIDRYGTERFIRNHKGAKLLDKVHEPLFPGLLDAELWRVEFESWSGELVLVRLRDAVRQPDGSFHHSWLRVPPEIRTAHEAVAWTFGMTADEYAPCVET